MKKTLISTSILAADLSDIKGLVSELSSAHADYLHLDVMDGHFVPNISFGPKVTEDINKITDLPLDVHLMISEPAKYIDQFAAAGSDIITIHCEAEGDLRANLKRIRDKKIKAGVSIKPATPASVLKEFLNMIDLVLVMSVEPGFGGQKFMPDSLAKVRELRGMIDDGGYDIMLEIDGGITDANAAAAAEAGCDMLVAGSFITNSKDKRAAILSLKNAK